MENFNLSSALFGVVDACELEPALGDGEADSPLLFLELHAASDDIAMMDASARETIFFLDIRVMTSLILVKRRLGGTTFGELLTKELEAVPFSHERIITYFISVVNAIS